MIAATSSIRILQEAANAEAIDVAVYDLEEQVEGKHADRYAGSTLANRVELDLFD